MGRKEKFIKFGEDVDGIISIILYIGSGKGKKCEKNGKSWKYALQCLGK